MWKFGLPDKTAWGVFGDLIVQNVQDVSPSPHDGSIVLAKSYALAATNTFAVVDFCFMGIFK